MLKAMQRWAILSVIGVISDISITKMLADIRKFGMIENKKRVSAAQRRNSKQLKTVLEELEMNGISPPY